jgi:Protein of unknown function (DUF3307)
MPADPVLTLAWLVLAHLVADFVIQGGTVVIAKNARGRLGWLGLGAHGLEVAICLLPVAIAFGLPGLWTLLAITGLHVVIDRTKVVLTRRAQRRAVDAADERKEGQAPAAGLGRAWTPVPAAYFIADQAAHIAVTFVAWAIWLSGQAPTAWWSDFTSRLFAGRDLEVVHDVTLWLVVVTALLIANIRAGALFVATLVRPIEFGVEMATALVRARTGAGALPPPPPAPPVRPARSWDIRIGPLAARVDEDAPPDEAVAAAEAARSTVPPPSQVGATIGVLERLLIVTFVLAGADAAIGFVIAAKTIARFRLLDDRDFAEYYLLGTLASVSVAIFTGLAARAALGA